MRDRSEGIHPDSTDNDESSSNSAKSRYRTGNSYININADVRTSYLSLVECTSEEYDANGYDALSEDLASNTLYTNLHVLC